MWGVSAAAHAVNQAADPVTGRRGAVPATGDGRGDDRRPSAALARPRGRGGLCDARDGGRSGDPGGAAGCPSVATAPQAGRCPAGSRRAGQCGGRQPGRRQCDEHRPRAGCDPGPARPSEPARPGARRGSGGWPDARAGPGVLVYRATTPDFRIASHSRAKRHVCRYLSNGCAAGAAVIMWPSGAGTASSAPAAATRQPPLKTAAAFRRLSPRIPGVLVVLARPPGCPPAGSSAREGAGLSVRPGPGGARGVPGRPPPDDGRPTRAG